MPALKKRSVLLAGHATSIALEPEFWAVLEAMAAARGSSLAGLILTIDRSRGERALASACRVAEGFTRASASDSRNMRGGSRLGLAKPRGFSPCGGARLPVEECQLP